MKTVKRILAAVLALGLMSLGALAEAPAAGAAVPQENFAESEFAAELEAQLRETFGDALALFYDAETSTLYMELPADTTADTWAAYTEGMNTLCNETKDAMDAAGYTDIGFSLSLLDPEDATTVLYACVNGFDVFNIAP